MDDRPVILVVDDTEIDRAILREFLRDEYNILEASNGREALELLATTSARITLLIVDILMPVMDGYELLEHMHRSDRLRDIPVIIMTARRDDNTEQRAMELGAADYITKPFNVVVARCRVKNVISRKEIEWRRAEQLARESQLAQMHKSLELDSLTDIYNREAFYRRAALMLHKNTDTKYSIVYLNINCFKTINALYRMEMGDLILKTAAYYFRAAVGEEGLFSRIEADHFAICLPTKNLDIDDMLAGLDTTMQSLGISYQVRFYAGIYNVDNINLPLAQMCDLAHVALSRVQGSYTRRYAYYDEEDREQMRIEQMMVRDMEYALQSGQFCIYLQPIYNLRTHAVIGAEALVRWNHPKHGLIAPDKFIPVFERNGFIVHIDRFIWEQVCRLLRRQLDSGCEVVPVSINISRLNFYNIDLIDYLLDLLRRYDLQPSMLKLEVTEVAYRDNPEQLKHILDELKASGFDIMMDDFGRGDSSISMIRDLALDVLKLDMGFVRVVDGSGRASIIMSGLVSIAKSLGMGVIVEGVETEAQVAYLDRIGCTAVQGYYYSRPMPEDDFIDLLKKEQNIE